MPDTPPIAFIIFNRPVETARVFARIAAAKPSTLLLIADGPRPTRPGDVEGCAAAKRIVSRIDWPCEVLTNYSEENLGCRQRVGSGLTWVFEQVERAIILEDDCLPADSFFPYCAELLERYRDDERVMHIGGTNVQLGVSRTDDSYYYSKYCHVWGWATWRRAWRQFDAQMQTWRSQRMASTAASRFTGGTWAVPYWMKHYDEVASRKVDAWGPIWQFSVWQSGGLACTPDKNLISNIGFGANATHTFEVNRYANMPACELAFPLTHPREMKENKTADLEEFAQHYGGLAHFEQQTIIGRLRRAGRTALRKVGLLPKPMIRSSC